MKIPLTRYGLPQVVIFPVILVTAGIVLAVTGAKGGISPVAAVVSEILLLVVLVWTVSFFRDPNRQPPQGKEVIVSPADGKITDIEKIDNVDFIEAPALKLGIFLNIFNVHINRCPARAEVKNIIYRRGKKKNAMNPESSRVNESNTLHLLRTDFPEQKMIVKQISGAIARRIVCEAEIGDRLGTGEKFGMIKYGSRTELYLPVDDSLECLVKIGDKVKAGTTVLYRYRERNSNE
jgi:phosphatidylserine decarboxylase